MLVKGGGAAWHLRKDDQELEIAEQAGRDADVGVLDAGTGMKKCKTTAPRMAKSSRFRVFYFLRVARCDLCCSMYCMPLEMLCPHRLLGNRLTELCIVVVL
jgi:hypothetical protein